MLSTFSFIARKRLSFTFSKAIMFDKMEQQTIDNGIRMFTRTEDMCSLQGFLNIADMSFAGKVRQFSELNFLFHRKTNMKPSSLITGIPSSVTQVMNSRITCKRWREERLKKSPVGLPPDWGGNWAEGGRFWWLLKSDRCLGNAHA